MYRYQCTVCKGQACAKSSVVDDVEIPELGPHVISYDVITVQSEAVHCVSSSFLFIFRP